MITLTVAHAQPGQRALEEFCPHFAANAPILWTAPSNSLPNNFWIYRRLPTQPFPEQLISNAVMLAGLQDRGIHSPGTNDFFITKKMPENFPGPIPTLLEILPRKGTISHSQAEPETAATNIPSDEILISRAQSDALRLGVDLKQVLQQRPVSHFSSDARGFWITNQINTRSVFFARLLDGVPFLDTGDLGGSDGFWIEFGSGGIMRSFSLVWPPLERYEQRTTASSEQIIACIRAFKTLMPPVNDGDQYFEHLKRFAQARSLTITNITPYYGEGIYGQVATNDEPTPFIYPLAVLDAEANFGTSNVAVQLYSPIVVSEVSRLLGGDEPTYQGRKLSQWLRDFDDPEKSAMAAEAMRHMGSAVVPMVLAQLRAANAKQLNEDREHWQAEQARAADNVTVPRPPNRRKEALAALDALGPAAEAALPTLELLLQEDPPDPSLPYVAARMGPASTPLLRRCLTNDASSNAKIIRMGAKICLEMLATRSELLYPKIPVGPDAPSYDRRICEFNLKILSAAVKIYKAEHAGMQGGEITAPPPPMVPQ